jgi:hypothetical protein
MMKSNIFSVMKLIGLMVIAMVLLSACAARAPSPPQSSEMAISGQDSFAPNYKSAPTYAPAQPQAGEGGFASTAPSSVERMVIKNAKLSLIVKEPPTAMTAIAEMAERMGGYVVSADLYQTTTSSGKEVPRASITIRVAAEKLNQALDEIKSLSDEPPQSENITSQDITAEYTDLESRLRNLKRAEEQLQEILDQAYSTEDVLNVYQQLTQVREQIEVIEGQMKYYRESVALSAISVELIAAEEVEPLTVGNWRPVGVARDALQALINTVQFLINAAIWVIIFVLPVLLLIYVIFVLPLRVVWRLVRRRKKTQAPATTQPTDSSVSSA